MNSKKLRRPDSSLKDDGVKAFSASHLKLVPDEGSTPSEKAIFGVLLGGSAFSIGGFRFSFKEKNGLCSVVDILRGGEIIATENLYYDESKTFRDPMTDATIKITLIHPFPAGVGLSVSITKRD
ncbi:hypothetical protein KKE92_05020 [Candidatus Micrarchaeota archaeon]|nr:hypothetical protein [Candidatus Micrarchaeota archaeon]MBU1682056.1 hypothetical protein [Candidatus Micrarchaeota archaeon]